MDELISYCGFNCEECQVNKATISNDKKIMEKVLEEWGDYKGRKLKAEDMWCESCKGDGIKNPFCYEACDIRKCAINKNLECCTDCSDMLTCEKRRKCS